MDLLMKEGGLRRNVLERKTTLAKSSLASTLSQLEKKKLVKVNRQTTVHFVETTEWFDSL